MNGDLVPAVLDALLKRLTGRKREPPRFGVEVGRSPVRGISVHDVVHVPSVRLYTVAWRHRCLEALIAQWFSCRRLPTGTVSDPPSLALGRQQSQTSWSAATGHLGGHAHQRDAVQGIAWLPDRRRGRVGARWHALACHWLSRDEATAATFALVFGVSWWSREKHPRLG